LQFVDFLVLEAWVELINSDYGLPKSDPVRAIPTGFAVGFVPGQGREMHVAQGRQVLKQDHLHVRRQLLFENGRVVLLQGLLQEGQQPFKAELFQEDDMELRMAGEVGRGQGRIS